MLQYRARQAVFDGNYRGVRLPFQERRKHIRGKRTGNNCRARDELYGRFVAE